MFRMLRDSVTKIEREVRVPLTGTRSYLVTVSQGATFVKPAFVNGAKVTGGPVDWCHNIRHEPRDNGAHDEFLESLPEADAFLMADREDRGL